MAWLIILSCLFSAALFVGALAKAHLSGSRHNSFPLPPADGGLHSIPVVAFLLTLARQRPIEYVFGMYKRHGRTFRAWLGPVPAYMSAEPSVLSKAWREDLDFVVPIAAFQTLLGDNRHQLSHQTHPAWRAIQAAGTTPKWVDAMVPGLVAVAERHVAHWEKHGSFSIYQAAIDAAVDISTEVTSGVRLPVKHAAWAKDKVKEFILGFYCAPINLPGFAFYNAAKAKAALMDVLWEEMQSDVEAILAQASTSSDSNSKLSSTEHKVPLQGYLPIQLLSMQPFKQQMGKEECTTAALQAVFASADTTRVATSHLLTVLAMSDRVRAKIKEEQEQVIAEHGPQLTPQALAAMRYLEAAVKEVLRLMPASQGGFRRVYEPVQAGKFVIPAGSLIWWNPTLCHALDPACWDGDTSKPVPCHMDVLNCFEEAFRPERWLDPDTKPQSYCTFGNGKRLCLGERLAYVELKVLAATMLRKMDFRLQDPAMLAKATFFPTFKPKPGTDTIVVTSMANLA